VPKEDRLLLFHVFFKKKKKKKKKASLTPRLQTYGEGLSPVRYIGGDPILYNAKILLFKKNLIDNNTPAL
jgi:hypothetical protein